LTNELYNIIVIHASIILRRRTCLFADDSYLNYLKFILRLQAGDI